MQRVPRSSKGYRLTLTRDERRKAEQKDEHEDLHTLSGLMRIANRKDAREVAIRLVDLYRNIPSDADPHLYIQLQKSNTATSTVLLWKARCRICSTSRIC